jgi:hypothetical protein
VPEFDEGDSVGMAMFVNSTNGRHMSKIEFIVATRRYVEAANKYEYQLKVSNDSETLHEDGKWFGESVLDEA